eukprot:TRINITY_DN849_c0_g1_i1.p1 TRINITY_DN849_c0_g1~~TRINITY_DN849_c0_g1_i1.p1  ORF type:complete len:271 (+),score=37.52 TRINITY_DN849_c0_g1_i1:58-813(+)
MVIVRKQVSDYFQLLTQTYLAAQLNPSKISSENLDKTIFLLREIHQYYKLYRSLYYLKYMRLLEPPEFPRIDLNSTYNVPDELKDDRFVDSTVFAVAGLNTIENLLLFRDISQEDHDSLLNYFSDIFTGHPPPKPDVKKSNREIFSELDDHLIVAGVKLHGTRNWGRIQKEFLPSKTKTQIQHRWKNRTAGKAPENPIKTFWKEQKRELTVEERSLLEKGMKQGYTFQQIARMYLPHKTPITLEKQYKKLS